jgi:hypothetical protein
MESEVGMLDWKIQMISPKLSVKYFYKTDFFVLLLVLGESSGIPITF